MTKKTYKVNGMHCTSCAMVIESDLEDRGVAARCSYARQTVEVEYDEKHISNSDIKEIIVKSGYRVIDS